MSDKLGLNTVERYSIPCKCGQVESRVKEHYWQIPLGQMEKSAVENHNF